MPRTQKMLYVGTNRFVAALDPATGEEIWRQALQSSLHSSVVSILIKGPHLFAGCGGRAYCLDRRTGEIIWKNGLPKMGYQAVLLAMEGAVGCTSDAAAAAMVAEEEATKHAGAS